MIFDSVILIRCSIDPLSYAVSLVSIYLLSFSSYGEHPGVRANISPSPPHPSSGARVKTYAEFDLCSIQNRFVILKHT